MSRIRLDALFVINQDAPFLLIRKICKDRSYRKICLLTTHYLFSNEREYVRGFADEVRIHTFADFLNDEEMSGCDSMASRDVSAHHSDKIGTLRFTEFFINESLSRKNLIVSQKITQAYEVDRIYYSLGLGLSALIWEKTGHVLTKGKKRFCPKFFSRLKLLFTRMNWHVVYHDTKFFVFFSSGRLRFAQNIKSRQYSFLPIQHMALGFFLNGKKDIFRRFIGSLPYKKSEIVIASTIHHHDDDYNDLGYPLQIFIDGFHPPNYTRSYLDGYPDCEFVVKDMVGEKWFLRFGKKTVKPPSFILREFFNFCRAGAVKNVLLALNHAGDWSALINRSDTDMLLESFAGVARGLRDVNFVIRLHPTMSLPEHEGINAVKRIERYLEYCNLSNLTLSRCSLPDDLQRADVCVSEYSQVLLDAIKSGKIGIIANLTNRRSFMQEYEIMGFLSADSHDSLENILTDISRQPELFVQKQNKAVSAYNLLMRQWYEG
jgi:hypothetical protein